MELSGGRLSLEVVAAVAKGATPVVLSDAAVNRIRATRSIVERLLVQGRVVYRVNTGFGKLADIRIPDSEVEALQLDLVRSHACGLGAPLSEPETRAMMLLRGNVLAVGSGPK
jgi:histidine ammonia-lyase